MNRFRLVVLGMIIILLCGGTWVTASEESEESLCIPMGIIALEPPEEVEAKRAHVEFPHSVHFDYNCQACHHKWEKEDEILGCMTSGCHDLTESPKAENGGKVDPEEAILYYKKAYHALCIGCHKNINEKNKALATSGAALTLKLSNSGPTSCKACHPKE